ncbi:MAG: response regulator [Acidobacteria bacterium]|nr:response regulator [Acidobacteriota bacterium]
MVDFFRELFSTNFMPHGMCYLWDPGVLWLNVLSDVATAAAYYAIPILLFRFARQRRDVSFQGIFLAFGVFILACGTTHLMEAITVWTPVYRVEGLVKAVTAMASIATFAILAPMVPQLVKLPSPAQLAQVNQRLAGEIEERRAAEDAVRRSNEELEERVARRTAEREALQSQLIHAQKMEAVGRLAGGVAHDFNNLLTVILGYNEMLREKLDGDTGNREYAEEVHRAAQRATDLTNQLLAFSRRQVAVPRLVDLNVTVRLIDKMLRRLIGEDVILEMHLAEKLPPVKADSSHIDQVIMNLAINARDAMPEGGRLLIETAGTELSGEYAAAHLGVQPGHYVMLAVSDTGVGMDDATRARIFEPFFTTKELGKGTGLGLSIVYGIVKQNGGEITVYSEPGRGTTFKIYLPVVEEEAENRGAEAVAAIPAGGETILLVEDEEQVRSLVRTMLSRYGYTVLEAADAGEARRVAAQYSDPIHLLLTDVVMPGMGGGELARELGAARPGMRILYMSGYTENAIVRQAELSPEMAFLPKPFTAEGLHGKVRDVLGRER